MKHENEKYYGERKGFAIRYLENIENSDLPYCHLMLAGKIIGDINEPTYLRTWKYSIEILKEEIENGHFKVDGNIVFENKSDEKIFDLIWNENQEYRNLRVSIDETIDTYLLSLIEKEVSLEKMF